MTLAPLLPIALNRADLTDARATLPIVELDRARVQRGRAHIRPLPTDRDELRVTAWNLYHAAKKAELACRFTTDSLDHLAHCFANEHHGLFRWNGEELRLSHGVTDMYETAARASRARTVGEGMLLLAMQHAGYVFWDRLDLLVKRALRRELLRHPESVRRARAIRKRIDARGNGNRSDFVIENGKPETALAEAKGSFVSPGATSTIKPDLRHALKQLAATKPLISPQPTKTYAVGTYLREVDDQHNEGSLIAFVDPADRDDAELAVEFPPDWIRRGNYAAWLLGMGFGEAANALRHGVSRDGITVSLPVKRVGGGEFAYVVSGVQLRLDRSRRLPREMIHDWWLHWPEFWFGPWREYVQLNILGLRVDVLAAVSRATVVQDGQVLLGIEPTPALDTGAFDGSVMPDGSMCGALMVDAVGEIEMREFAL